MAHYILKVLEPHASNRRVSTEAVPEQVVIYPLSDLRLLAGPAVVATPVHANNAAALAGNLAVGDLYRTGADPDVVCVVH